MHIFEGLRPSCDALERPGFCFLEDSFRPLARGNSHNIDMAESG